MTYPPTQQGARTDASTATPNSHSADHTTLDTCITSIVTELGSQPRGASTDLTARLTALDATVATPQTSIRGLTLPGSNQNYPTCPTNLVSGSHDLDVRIEVLPTSYVVSSDQHLIGQWDDTDNKGWKVKLVGGTGEVELAWTTDGKVGTTIAVARSLTGYVVDGRPAWIRAVLDVDGGASNYICRLYVSYDYDIGTQIGTWTQLGADANNAGPTSIFASTAPLAVGVRNPGASGGGFLTGSVFAAEIRKDNVVVGSPNFTKLTAVSAGATLTDAQSNVWTLTSGSWSLTDFRLRSRWGNSSDFVASDGLVLPWACGGGLGGLSNAASMNSANTGRACRVRIPKTGTLHDLAVFPNAQSGNIDVAVYDTGERTNGSRTKLYGSGSVACPATAGWRIIGDPNIPVVAGQWVDFWIGADNTTATFLRMNAITGAQASLPTSFLPTPGGANSYYAWFSGASTFPAPSALTEASLTANGNCPVIIGRIT